MCLQSDNNLEKWKQSLFYAIPATVVNLFYCKQQACVSRVVILFEFAISLIIPSNLYLC